MPRAWRIFLISSGQLFSLRVLTRVSVLIYYQLVPQKTARKVRLSRVERQDYQEETSGRRSFQILVSPKTIKAVRMAAADREQYPGEVIDELVSRHLASTQYSLFRFGCCYLPPKSQVGQRVNTSTQR
jgi:hypothetical protein